MAHTACLVCLVNTVSGCPKYALGRGSASSAHMTKLEKSRFSLDIYGSGRLLKLGVYGKDSFVVYLFCFKSDSSLPLLKCKHTTSRGHFSSSPQKAQGGVEYCRFPDRNLYTN